ncbi:hypothetical protein JCM14450A_05010 [Geobacillus stearothermophilus]
MSPFLFSCQFMSVNLLIYSNFKKDIDKKTISDYIFIAVVSKTSPNDIDHAGVV